MVGRGRASGRPAQWGFVLPAAAYLLLFFGYPLVKNVVMSFQQYTTTTFSTGAAPFAGLRNYATILTPDLFSGALVNTFLFTTGSLLGQFVLGLALALFFQRRFPLGGVLRSLLLLPWLLPLVVSGTTWRWMLDPDTGVVNTVVRGLHLSSSGVPWLTGTPQALVSVILVNVWIGIPFNTAILYGGLQNIPPHLYEAAKLDGAGPVNAFRHITWPLLRPVVNVVLVLGVAYTVKSLDVILTVTGGGPAGSTETLATQAYKSSFEQFEFGRGAVLGNVLILVSFAFALLYLRRPPCPDRRTGGRVKRGPAGGPVSTVIGIVLLAVMLFPVYWMVNASLQPVGNTLRGDWFPLHPDFSGYTIALRDQVGALVTSLVVALGSMALSLGLAAPAAHALALFSLRGTDLVLLGVLVTQAVPGIVVADALYGAYTDLGLLNSHAGLILADSTAGVPFAILILHAFMRTIPPEVIEAARVDGAGRLRVFGSVVLPLSTNALITAAVFTFLFAWSDLLFALTLTTTPTVRPVTLGVYQYLGAHTDHWNAVMATTVMTSVPAVVLLVIAQRHVTAGATRGAVR
ncbi:ABC transporter permease subunit [Spirillospora sp. NPDC052269]